MTDGKSTRGSSKAGDARSGEAAWSMSRSSAPRLSCSMMSTTSMPAAPASASIATDYKAPRPIGRCPRRSPSSNRARQVRSSILPASPPSPRLYSRSFRPVTNYSSPITSTARRAVLRDDPQADGDPHSLLRSSGRIRYRRRACRQYARDPARKPRFTDDGSPGCARHLRRRSRTWNCQLLDNTWATRSSSRQSQRA